MFSSQGITYKILFPGTGCIMAAAFLALSAWGDTDQKYEITLLVNDHPIMAEVAHTRAARTQGLAHRQMLPESQGMLFIFPEPVLFGMWMRNTHVPLSVAFLDEHGVIINIALMQPNTLARHYALRPAKYALELNRGWFASHGVQPGMQIEGLERAPPPR
jgi:uncharacterized membrane protein (UPF0127 family)